ncbi:pseudouridine synthase [Buchnera aphidicola]|uniref:pseudouridine synthase n=1 Tax=Buchnera aphidicola TaxID=9 RepID=UPI003463C2BF
MTEKIQKLLSRSGYGSRRYIEKLIQYGDILVNGKKAIIGQRLYKNYPGEILIQGQLAVIKNQTSKSSVLLYNKSEGEICTRCDSQNRKTIFDNLPKLIHNRWISVGRLDLNTRGLLLFTNDGLLAYRLMHPKYAIEREYYIRVFGNINQNKINILKNGVKIKNKYLVFKKIEMLNTNKIKKNTWFKGVLCEGHNREIRSLFEFLQCQVSRLIRIRYGNIILPKNLKLNRFISLNSKVISDLYNLVGI